MGAADSIFLKIFRGIGGGSRIAVMINAYFDESAESDSVHGLLGVCGYAMDENSLNGFCPEWEAMLSRFNIPYFHMSECNVGCGVFRHLTDDECDQCAREAIRIARQYPLHGHAFVLDQTEYKNILENYGFNCDPYTFLVWCAFIHVNRWVHENRPEDKISLFYESGYKMQSRANELLQVVSQDQLRGRNRVVSYSFVKKEESPPAQAGDLVAWHVRKGNENLRLGKPVRRDTEALFENRQIWTIHWTTDLLEKIRRQSIERFGSLERASEELFSQVVRAPDEVTF